MRWYAYDTKLGLFCYHNIAAIMLVGSLPMATFVARPAKYPMERFYQPDGNQ
jgi:hypothetical protein